MAVKLIDSKLITAHLLKTAFLAVMVEIKDRGE
jgi:hypothetical protein